MQGDGGLKNVQGSLNSEAPRFPALAALSKLQRARVRDNAHALSVSALLVQRAFTTTPTAIGIFIHQIVANAVLAKSQSDPTSSLANTVATHLPFSADGAGHAAVCRGANERVDGCAHKCIDRCVHGRIHGCVHKCTDRCVHGCCIHRCIHGRVPGYTYGCVNESIDGCVYRCIHGCVHGRVRPDGRADVWDLLRIRRCVGAVCVLVGGGGRAATSDAIEQSEEPCQCQCGDTARTAPREFFPLRVGMIWLCGYRTDQTCWVSHLAFRSSVNSIGGGRR